MNIYCLGFSGISLTNEVLQVLFFGAQSMFVSGDQQRLVKFAFVEGEIKTDYQAGVLGSVGGYLFHASIDTPRGSTKVRYLVRKADFNVTPPESFVFHCESDDDPVESLVNRN